MVLGHEGQLKRLLETASGRPIPGAGSPSLIEELLDARLAAVRADILDGFERRLSTLEGQCEERIGEVQRQCHREHMSGQEQMQQSLDGRETGIREELGTLQAQIQGLTLTESCCGQVGDGTVSFASERWAMVHFGLFYLLFVCCHIVVSLPSQKLCSL